jgi:hypothetical protein
MAAGALTAGVLVLGFGGRLMMRVLAATSADEAQGRFTDAEEIVGRPTLGGTIGFVLFVGIAGGIVGMAMFAVLRPLLPNRSIFAGLIGGAIGAGLLGRPTGLIDPDNHDFTILSPSWLAVGLCIGLMVTFGMLLATLCDALAPRWPPPSWSLPGLAGMLPLVPLFFIPPFAVGVGIVLVARATLAPRAAMPSAMAVRFGHAAVLVIAIGGAAWTLLGAGQILTS